MAKLKPQDFPGMAGKHIKISELPTKLIAAIRSRKDLDNNLSGYLVKLVQYCDSPSQTIKADLGKFIKKVAQQDKNAIQKDFSELLGAIIIGNMNKAELTKLGLAVDAQSTLFIPTAGNYPLVDFMINTKKIEYQYSVKTLQKTTNTLKAQDILATVSTTTKRKYAKETQLLEMISEYDAKLGPILALAKIAPTMQEFKKSDKLYKQFITTKSINNDLLKEDPESWYLLFEPVIDSYYAGGKKTISSAWKKGYHYDALTVLAQYTVADATKDMNWMPFVDEVQKKVTYFKFGLKTDGTYEYALVNGMSERKANQKFRLRAKSRIKESAPSSRSGQDKLGIQP